MSADGVPLHQHTLKHVPVLGVDEALVDARFAAGCQTGNCRGVCCKGGVWVDVEERAAILAHASRVASMMDPTQDHDPSHWFESTDVIDPDFPSGRAVGTEVVDNRCVFLDSASRCTLQRAEQGLGRRLKPFFCRIFPIALDHGILTLDDTADDQLHCCGPTPAGAASVFDVCPEELDEVLGPAGVEELRHLAARRNRN